ncbi:MAG TPA: LytTR family DNA-binding domain-containing protein [Bacteroidales bacterium]|nr:LytTR family DNA-binding domain-containing protein [Bacteroidales bacterium]
MKVIIVEDEAHSRKTLSNFLHKYCPEIEITAQADTVNSAILSVNTTHPDLLFLDIDLPDGSGFDVLDSIVKPWPKIIFVTAYNQYAVKAFQISAIDYLLKPIDPQLLIKAVQKASSNEEPAGQMVQKMEVMRENRISGQLHKIAIPSQNGIQMIRIEDIVRFEADGNYTTIFMRDKSKLVVTKKIKEFEMLLEGLHFYRLHQSHIVNLHFVERYIRGEGGTVVLEDGSQIEVARRRKEDFLDRLSHF